MEKVILKHLRIDSEIRNISEKIIEGERVTASEALFQYEKAELNLLGMLAHKVRSRINGKNTYFNRNFHLEPTNICIHNCRFCSYSRKMGEKDIWEYSLEEMLKIVSRYKNSNVTEVHIVGGVHPNRDLEYYGKLIQEIKKLLPDIHVKAFTAVELDHMIKKAHLSVTDGLKKLKQYGLDSIPGGGAEIFNPEIRRKICHEKSDSNTWLAIHEAAHREGIQSNATMLYGHIENYSHRVDHLSQLRNLQDKTNGFNAFIPLKYKNKNKLSNIEESTIIEDLKNFAVCRIFLDNIPHLKAYWPMTGKEIAQLSLEYGVDDLDGTIDDTTKIYSMAGSMEVKPGMTASDMKKLITGAGFKPVERDSVYNIISKD